MDKLIRRFLFTVSFGSVLLSCSDQTENTQVRPNIVFVLADDLRVGAMGYEGNEVIQTPFLDSLAREGYYFENAFVTTPICCSSRASILSGQYTRSHGIVDFQKSFSDSALLKTYPVLLREAGYYSGFVGKYGVGITEEDMPKDQFDYWKGFDPTINYGQGHYWQDSVHLTKRLEAHSLAFLENIPENQPFCLSVSFKAPHVQDSHPDQFLYDTTRFSHLYANDIIPEANLSDPAFWDMFPEFFKMGDSSETRLRWNKRFATPELYQQMVKGYYRLIAGIDEAVGAIREKLDKEGLSENTIIIFTSDNGFYLGERGLAGKWFSHDESIRVPMIVFDPRNEQKGDRRDKIALNIDIAPTILAYARLEIPEEMEGRSLIHLIDGTDEDWRTDFLFEHRFERYNIPESEGIVNLQAKYIKYIEEDPPYNYLYDLTRDPDEVINFSDTLSYEDISSEMNLRYQELLNQISN